MTLYVYNPTRERIGLVEDMKQLLLQPVNMVQVVQVHAS